MIMRMRNAGIATLLIVSVPVRAQSYDPALTPHVSEAGVTVEEEWHENGQIAKRAFRRDGEIQGLYQEWNPDGSLRLVAEWRDGKGEGVWMYFNPSGFVSERSYATRDRWHGLSEGWHADGTKAFEGRFDMGFRDGPFRYWDEAGNLIGPGAQLLPTEASPRPVMEGFWPEGFNPWDVTFSTDLQTVFVGTGDNEGNNRRILMRTWTREGWSEPEPAPFGDLTAAEGTPVMSHDGAYLYFSSDRHAKAEPDNNRRDLYRVSRQSGWTDVERVTNTPAYGEVSLTTAQGNLGVLWTDRRLDGEARIGLYEVSLDDDVAGLAIVRPLDDLHPNDSSGEAYPALSPDGSMLLFSNFDLAGQGTAEDLYLSMRVNGEWSPPTFLPAPFSSNGNDSAVQFIDAGKVIIFNQSNPTASYFFSVTVEDLLALDDN